MLKLFKAPRLLVYGVPIIVLVVWIIVHQAISEERTRKYRRCWSLVNWLDTACKTYKVDYGEYPPSSGADSSVLHKALGSKRRILANPDSAPTEHIYVDRPPMIELQADHLDLSEGRTDLTPNPPVAIIDPWGRPVRYRNPGVMNKGLFDIWSLGEDVDDDSDDVKNWHEDF